MLWTAFGSALPQAVGIAISPIPIILVILMLVSAKARVNGPAFLAGWMVGVLVVTAAAYAIADAAEVTTDSGAADGANALQLILGILLIGLAVKKWRGRPQPGEVPETPKIFSAVDQMGAARALGLGLVACVVNPKNLPLAISGGASIGQSGATGGAGIGAVLLFMAAASASVAAPVVVYFGLGDRSADILAGWKRWLIANNDTVMMILFAVLGAKVFGSGLGLLG
jgi:hypothetical protein